MSWKKTTICGRVMFEREDGVRVDSDEQIKAIEESERQAFRSREYGYPLDEKEPESDESSTLACVIATWIIVMGLMAVAGFLLAAIR